MVSALAVSSQDANWGTDPFGWRDLQNLRRVWRQVLFAWFWMQFCSYCDCLSMAHLQEDPALYLAGHVWRPVPDNRLEQVLSPDDAARAKKSVFLYDVGHHLLPHVDPFWCDVYATSATVLFYIRFIIFPGPRAMRWTLLKRLWLHVGFVRLLRSFTIQGTVLPNPDLDCVPRLHSPSNVWIQALWIQSNLDVTCQDVLFSEHTCILALMSMFWACYAYHTPLCPHKTGARWFEWKDGLTVQICLALFSLSGFAVIIGSRFHYTDDVLLAVLLCSLFFGLYHAAIRAAPFHDGIVWRWLRRFEADSPDMQQWLQQADSLGIKLLPMYA